MESKLTLLTFRGVLSVLDISFIMVYMEKNCCLCATGEFLTGLDKAEQCC